MILFNQLSKATRLKELAINNDELKLIKYTSLSSKLMIELRSSYEEYLKTAVKREIKTEIKKEKKSEVRKEALGPIIVEPEKLSFLTNEDKEIYLGACNLISSLVGRSDYDYYMEALLDIQSLEELYNDEDREYFDEIINDAINKLKILLNMFHIDKKIRKPEVVFLNDIKGNCYFKEDLDKMKVVSQNIYKEYIEEGIQVSDNDGKLVEVVPPGGLDREVLGLDLVDKFMKFFISKFLNAMSINCTLREKRVFPGESKHFFGNKQLKSESDENVKLLIMTYICGKEAE